MKSQDAPKLIEIVRGGVHYFIPEFVIDGFCTDNLNDQMLMNISDYVVTSTQSIKNRNGDLVDLVRAATVSL